MNNVTLGKYLPLDSFVHKLDPRIKICIMVVLMVAVFLPCGFWGHAIVGGFLLIALVASKISVKYVYKSFKPIIFTMLFLLVINVLVIKTGDVLIDLGFISIYTDAIIQTLYIAIRLLLMIVVTTLLTATTKPLDLTLGIEDLLTPFEKLGMRTHDLAMMISLALRFIPSLLEEAQRILKAQASRGVDIENGNFKEKISAILSLIVPLFVSCFQRADDLADAMEARGYIVGGKRVRYKQLHLNWKDVITLCASLVLLVFLIVVGPKLNAL